MQQSATDTQHRFEPQTACSPSTDSQLHPHTLQALNLLLTDERAVLVDIRTSREVVERGRPLLPPPHEAKYVPRARHVVSTLNLALTLTLTPTLTLTLSLITHVC